MKKIKVSKKVQKVLIGLSAITVSVISFLVAQKIRASKKVKALIFGLTSLVAAVVALFLITKKDKKGENK